MKQLNHRTLAIVSGIILIIIIGANVVIKPNKDVRTDGVQTGDVQTEKIDKQEYPTELPQTRITNPNAVIDLSGDRLSEIPEIVYKRTNIEVLNVSNNNLRDSLKAEIRHMTSLRVLDLSNNMFTGVPAEVGQLENLEVLDLSNNRITGLPHEIGNLQKLKVLDVSGNEYSKHDIDIIIERLPETTKVVTE